jgi:hypothetical protein
MERLLLLFCLAFAAVGCFAEERFYVGVIGGVSTLSADAGSQATPNGLSVSSYAPQSGGAFNTFVGVHFHNYFSAQANYIWNQNDLVLNSTSSESGSFYEEARSSTQHAFIADFLIYFRKRGSRIRPYLGTGTGVVHLESDSRGILRSGGTPVLPPASFTSNRVVLRSHVGIDFRLVRKLDFRYSFSETIGRNDISNHLLPPAPRRLANFQNLFGFVFRY